MEVAANSFQTSGTLRSNVKGTSLVHFDSGSTCSALHIAAAFKCQVKDCSIFKSNSCIIPVIVSLIISPASVYGYIPYSQINCSTAYYNTFFARLYVILGSEFTCEYGVIVASHIFSIDHKAISFIIKLGQWKLIKRYNTSACIYNRHFLFSCLGFNSVIACCYLYLFVVIVLINCLICRYRDKSSQGRTCHYS